MFQNSWNAGITLSVPLFQGGLTRGRVSEARANLLVLEAQRDTIRQSILLELNQAFADMEGAVARVEVMESTVKKARENLELAQGRYEAGIGPYIEVTDAQLSAVNAETDHIQALYDYQLAVARLLKAMGTATTVIESMDAVNRGGLRTMPTREVTFTVKLPIRSVWSFMIDRKEVGCLFPGCKGVEILNDLDSIWNIKMSLGPFTRMVEMHAHTTELIEHEKICMDRNA